MEKKRLITLLSLLLVFIMGIIVFLYNNICTITFKTYGGTKIESVKILKGNKIKLPDNPKKDNYIFSEWQVNGKKFNENKPVEKDMVLKAKYLPEVYATITFDSDGGTSVSSMSVLVGKKIDKKLINQPVKEGYNFDGWYLNNKRYNFKNKVVGNITLKAQYTKAGDFISNNDLKIGDEVEIIGNYASSAYDNYAHYTKAIGWKRIILKIYEGTEYPYQVGNIYGVTGYFKSISLKK